jgi:hypothetical protein
LAYNLRYYGDHSKQLANDLFNAKKPNSNDYNLAVKITSYLTKNHLDVPGLADKLKVKWQNPADTMREGYINESK